MIITVNDNPQHPIEQLLPQLQSLLADVQERKYSFGSEIDEIKQMQVSLISDPEHEVVGLNVLYGTVQGFLSRITYILLQVYEEKSVWLRYKHIADGLYRKAKNRLSAQENIRTAKNKEIQEALIQEEIPELSDIRDYIDFIIEDLDELSDIIKAKRDDLDKINTNLSRQQKVIDTLVGLNYPVTASRGE